MYLNDRDACIVRSKLIIVCEKSTEVERKGREICNVLIEFSTGQIDVVFCWSFTQFAVLSNQYHQIGI